jgi:WD40 repeat protein
VAVSPDGNLLASAATDQTIKIWDLKTGLEKLTLKGHAGHAIALAFAPDNKTLFSSGTDRNIYKWDVTTGTRFASPNTWMGLQIPAPVLQVSADGKKLQAWTPVGAFSTKVKVFDTANGMLLMEGTDDKRNVLDAAFTPDGKTIALPAADGSVRVYLVNNNQMEIQPGGDWFTFKINVKATSAAFTTDGKTIAAGNEKGEIKIADVAQRNVLHTLEGHKSKVRTLVFSPDGKLLASSGDDNVIKLWDAKTGKMLRQWDIDVPIQFDRNFTPQMVFTPDSKSLITANANTTLYVLELP